jgi:hypothetical protein
MAPVSRDGSNGAPPTQRWNPVTRQPGAVAFLVPRLFSMVSQSGQLSEMTQRILFR